MSEFDPKVAHVLRRATLGPTYEEVQAASRAGLDATLARMVSEVDRPLTEQEEAAAAIGDVFLKDGKSLRAGWMLRMLNSPNLFREKLTLFWHNHFATAVAKVNDTRAMANQIKMMRSIGVGTFRQMLSAIARDPAMLIWLDNALNIKGRPNENFARELMAWPGGTTPTPASWWPCGFMPLWTTWAAPASRIGSARSTTPTSGSAAASA